MDKQFPRKERWYHEAWCLSVWILEPHSRPAGSYSLGLRPGCVSHLRYQALDKAQERRAYLATTSSVIQRGIFDPGEGKSLPQRHRVPKGKTCRIPALFSLPPFLNVIEKVWWKHHKIKWLELVFWSHSAMLVFSLLWGLVIKDCGWDYQSLTSLGGILRHCHLVARTGVLAQTGLGLNPTSGISELCGEGTFPHGIVSLYPNWEW